MATTESELEPDGQRAEQATVVAADGVAKQYDSLLPFSPSVSVLEDATLEVRRGEVVGIMGENGSGKSTLMQILAGVLDADAGTVERAGSVGWCPQEPRLYDRLTVAETFRLFGRAYDMSDDEIAEARDWLTDVLDFEQFLDRQVRHLSGGNRQKLNLSVALMHEPDLLLLDEPYTGFDWETFLAFWELTEDLRDRGVGVAIISHIINERDRFDVVYELHDGHLHRETVGAEDDLDPEPTDDDADCARADAAANGQHASTTEGTK